MMQGMTNVVYCALIRQDMRVVQDATVTQSYGT
jgi:hypothetical protein